MRFRMLSKRPDLLRGKVSSPCVSPERYYARCQETNKLTIKRVAVTVTSTILQTITRIATQRATIVIAEIVTSTAISTILVTISTAATQTDVVWATVTAVAKREAPSADLPQPSGRENALLTPSLAGGRASRPSEPVKKGLSKVLRDAPIPRQADVPTVTNYVTQTTDVTSISSTIITTHTTSTGVTTVYQTSTR